MIAVIDYGMGNLQSVCKGLERAGARVRLARRPGDVSDATGIVLPGVGAFGAGIRNLRESGFVSLIKEKIAAGVPFLGICLGMQLLFSRSEEHGAQEGLGIIPGRVVRFPSGVKVPHMGWNNVAVKRVSALWKGVGEGDYFYFVHSYYCVPEDETVVAAVTEYALPFTSAVHRENLFATQFHPEKSQKKGLRLLENFVRLAEGGGAC